MKLTGDEQERTHLGPAFTGLEAGLDPAGTGVMGIGLAAEVLEVWGGDGRVVKASLPTRVVLK